MAKVFNRGAGGGGSTFVLDYITITTPPHKVEYRDGDSFIPDGIVVTATYTNGMSYTTTAYSWEPTVLKEGMEYVTVSVTDGRITKTEQVKVTVKPALILVDMPYMAAHYAFVYNGMVQTPNWVYDAEHITIGGGYQGREYRASGYQATFTLKENCAWSNGYPSETYTISWGIAKYTVTELPVQSNELVYMGYTQAPSFNNFNFAYKARTGEVDGKDAGDYTVHFVLDSDNCQWDGALGIQGDTADVVWTIQKAPIASVPKQNGSLTFNGAEQSPAWSGYPTATAYREEGLDYSGEKTGTDAGTYTATFTPTKNFKWADGEQESREAQWVIGKAAGKVSVTPQEVTLDEEHLSVELTATKEGDGALRASVDNPAVASVEVSGDKVTVSAVEVGNVPIATLSPGAIVQFNENGRPADYYVAAHNYESGLNGEGRTLVVRKDCFAFMSWDTSKINAYATSSIDTWLNGTYKSMLDEGVQEAIGQTKFPYTIGDGNTEVSELERSVFLLSCTEYGKTKYGVNVEGTVLPIAEQLIPTYVGTTLAPPWTRTPYTSKGYVFFINKTVGSSAATNNTYCNDVNYGVRPSFTVPANYQVKDPEKQTSTGENIKKLKEFAPGDIIKLNENGSPVNFYVAQHNYESSKNGAGRTLLVRKDCYDKRVWHTQNVNAYATSDIDKWLNETYKTMLDGAVLAAIGTTKIPYTPGSGDTTVQTLDRSVFLLSCAEYGLTYTFSNSEGTAVSCADAIRVSSLDGEKVIHWTRTPRTNVNTSAVYIGTGGGCAVTSCTTSYGARPAFTLPEDFEVQDTSGTFASLEEGDTVTLKEGNHFAEFYVAKHGYQHDLNSDGLTLLVRKDCYSKGIWKSENSGYYQDSDVDTWLNNDYLSILGAPAVYDTIIYYTRTPGYTTTNTMIRKVFLLSCTELGFTGGNYNVEGEALPIATALRSAKYNGEDSDQWTRSCRNDSDSGAKYVNTSQALANGATNTNRGIRPAFALPSKTPLPDYSSAERIGDVPEGTIIQLEENGAQVDFYVAQHNYGEDLNGEGRTLVLRKEVYGERAWSTSTTQNYAESSIDTWLNADYKSMLAPSVQDAIKTTKIQCAKIAGTNNTVDTIDRSIFLLYCDEFGVVADYSLRIGSKVPIADLIKKATMNGTPSTQWTRTGSTSGYNAISLNSAGVFERAYVTYSRGVRPAFTLPATFKLRDSAKEYGKGKTTVKIYTEEGKNYTESEKANIPVKAFMDEHIWGVEYDPNNSSTKLKRLTAANDTNGFVTTDITEEPVPAVGTGNGSSPFDKFYPWREMTEYNFMSRYGIVKKGESMFSRANYNTGVYIPPFWYYRDRSAGTDKLYICDSEALAKENGFSKHPGSGRYIGRYETTGQGSASGKPVQLSKTLEQFRTMASGMSDEAFTCHVNDAATLDALRILYLVEFADTNSQAAIGNGVCGASQPAITGGTDAMVYHTGKASESETAPIQYRWVENPWGNIREAVDGIAFLERRCYVAEDPAVYSSDPDTIASTYTDTGVDIGGGGWIKDWAAIESAPWLFVPAYSGGSSSTYVPDYSASGAGNNALHHGGPYGFPKDQCGLFAYFASNTLDYSNGSNLGARFMFIAKD